MRSLHMLIKPASGSCNMRCRYCFYENVTEAREIKDYGMMDLKTMEIIVQKALAEVTESCSFGFQGGEPTLIGLDFFREFVRFVATYNTKGITVQYALQTNGLAIDEEWAAFLAEHHFLVGLSIDGGKQVHDTLRVDIQNRGTHKKCMQTARLLSQYHVEFNILSVVTRQLAKHPDKAYQFYRQYGFDFIQFIPYIDDIQQPQKGTTYSLDAMQYGKFLCQIFDVWYQDFINGKYISIRIFDNFIRMLAGQPPENCAMGGICNVYALIEADGSVFPCDFYALDTYRLGNILEQGFEELLTSKVAETFVKPSLQIDETCKQCEFFFLCRGGCRRNREPIFEGKASRFYYCEGYRMLFIHALPRMQQIADTLFGE